MSASKQPTPAHSGQPGQDVDSGTRVIGVSRRIWIAFVVLIALLGYTGVSMFMARSELRELRSYARVTKLKLEHVRAEKDQALADKQQIIKELSEQGNRLAEFSRGEEQAKSALAAASSGAEEAEKLLSDLKARLTKAEKLARSASGAQAELKKLKEEVLALQTALDGTRAELEATQAELEKARAAAEPYSSNAQQPGGPGQ